MHRPRRNDFVPTPGRSFGVDLDVAFPCEGLPRSIGTPTGPRVRVELATQKELASAWPRNYVRLRRWGVPGQRPLVTLDAGDEAGYLFRVKGFGSFLVSHDGGHVRCAPARTTPGRWQRALAGQVLPFVAVLRGVETFHASAVVVGGRAIAFIGASGMGKSSLALSSVLRGARLITDDVLAVTIDDSGTPNAHHGFELANVRFDALARLTPEAIAALGPRVDEDDEGVRIRVRIARDPVPVGAICFLERQAGPGPLVERIQPVDPRLLLGATYNVSIQRPDRLIRQLDTCALLARNVPTYRIRIPPDRGPTDIVDEVVEATSTTRVAS